ncbi:MAG: hypothetical protein [Circular genetic element sp.]|nr:MAG: hypothetical protein [Circular genetic element sp.]
MPNGRYDDDSPYDDWDSGSTFNQDSEIITDINEGSGTLSGFSAGHGEGLISDDEIAGSDFAINEDGSFREKTQTEKLMRDYGMFIAVALGIVVIRRL